jgi:peptidoglycan biosynthesis protein MviN/MurJ (putative lipid II flippase)
VKVWSRFVNSSGSLALASVVSRVVGFVKVVVLVRAIGQVASPSADAFAIANQLPNNIYALIAGGLLSAVLVPHIVRAVRRADEGVAFINGVVTIGILTFALITIVAVAGAPTLIHLYSQSSANGSAAGILMVLAVTILIVVSFPIPRIFEKTYSDSSAMAFVLLGYLPGLVAFSALFVIQRTFYALGDTRTPFFFQLGQSVFFVAGAIACLALPGARIAVGIAVVTSLVGLGTVNALGAFCPGGFAQSGIVAALLTIAATGSAITLAYTAILAITKAPELHTFVQRIRT